MIRAISKCRCTSVALQGSFLLLIVSVNLLSSLLVSFTGEQLRPAGCGLCCFCCDWLVAHACVISCGTCSSSTPDTAWHSLIALPSHSYTRPQIKVPCLFAFSVKYKRTGNFAAKEGSCSVTLASYSKGLLLYQLFQLSNLRKPDRCCLLWCVKVRT